MGRTIGGATVAITTAWTNDRKFDGTSAVAGTTAAGTIAATTYVGTTAGTTAGTTIATKMRGQLLGQLLERMRDWKSLVCCAGCLRVIALSS